MSKVYSGSAVPRHFVFIMSDGAFVVQWDENRVQDILTGHYRTFEYNDFGHAIADYELNQLKSAGRVEHYNRNYVWLYSLPEPNRFQAELKTEERTSDHIRAYYLNTLLPTAQLENVRTLLKKMKLGDGFSANIRAGTVVIAGREGTPFLHFKEAEDVQRRLMSSAKEQFKDSAVAFVELRQSDEAVEQDVKQPEENIDLMTIIASQSDTSVTEGKHVVILMSDENEQAAIYELCLEMKMKVDTAATGWAAVTILEDSHVDLLIMDLELPDLHAWEMISKLKEIVPLRGLPIIIIADYSANNQTSLAFTVAQVDVFLTRPISRARLRQNIWMTLKDREERKNSGA